jgi:hypothetical protein
MGAKTPRAGTPKTIVTRRRITTNSFFAAGHVSQDISFSRESVSHTQRERHARLQVQGGLAALLLDHRPSPTMDGASLLKELANRKAPIRYPVVMVTYRSRATKSSSSHSSDSGRQWTTP